MQQNKTHSLALADALYEARMIRALAQDRVEQLRNNQAELRREVAQSLNNVLEAQRLLLEIDKKLGRGDSGRHRLP